MKSTIYSFILFLSCIAVTIQGMTQDDVVEIQMYRSLLQKMEMIEEGSLVGEEAQPTETTTATTIKTEIQTTKEATAPTTTADGATEIPAILQNLVKKTKKVEVRLNCPFFCLKKSNNSDKYANGKCKKYKKHKTICLVCRYAFNCLRVTKLFE